MAGGEDDTLLREWWAAWWSEGYTWPDLAKHKTFGDPSWGETLQDYWRRDLATGRTRTDAEMESALELVEHEGETFHIVHLPALGRTGSPTWKADLGHHKWHTLEALVIARLAAAAATEFDAKGDLTGPDLRAHLAGAVFRRSLAALMPAGTVLHIKAKRSATLGAADYGNARFGPGARFDWSLFCDGAYFNRARFAGEANFDLTLHCGETSFSSAEFGGLAAFIDARFRRRAYFRNQAKFNGDVWFDRAIFDQRVTFNTAAFARDMDFTAAEFNSVVLLEQIKWPEQARHWHSAFDQVLFRGKVSLSGSGFYSFAAFDGATLERGVQIDDPLTETAANERFRVERDLAIASAALDGEDERAKRPMSDDDLESLVGKQKDERLRQLERGCRVLKLAMDGAANKSLEQLLYRFELQARRAQRKLRFGEKFFSDLYGATSDYGASIWRPFAALGVLIVVSGGVFWSLAAMLDPSTEATLLAGAWHSQLFDALDYSWANVFKPLSALSERAAAANSGSMIHQLLTQTGPGWAFLVRVLATAESLLAITLAFLFGLAVRRRFQII